MDNLAVPAKPTFIDLFSGCGGLSLGLSQSGWQGLFAIERAEGAFETFKANFLDDGSAYQFQWPSWLPKKAHSIDDVLDGLTGHEDELRKLRNKVDLIAGGPPCQGFSFAGKRNSADPRNKMFQRYVSFVKLINPKFLVLENVPGMNVAHTKSGNLTAKKGQTYYDKLRVALGELDYSVGEMILDAADFGVPQRRARLVVLGIRSDLVRKLPTGITGVFNCIALEGKQQLQALGGGKHVTARQAISDLEVGNGPARSERTHEYSGSVSPRGYFQQDYQARLASEYQRRMNREVEPSEMDSMRLARHSEDVEGRFRDILEHCRLQGRLGVNLSPEDRDLFGLRKFRTVPMSADLVSPTLTTLPDDIIHYKDWRILTVRECARLQSFPDRFVFRSKYTTGGDKRKVECPRYTQVGNAVPPLLAEAIGKGIRAAWNSIEAKAAPKLLGKKTIYRKPEALTAR